MGSLAVMNRLTTVARIAPSIVSSNMMMMFGHMATTGIPPVSKGHAFWVPDASK